jgi:acrylyl-CoA reductase (NADPH)
MGTAFRAIVVEREADASGTARLRSGIREITLDDLRSGDAAPAADSATAGLVLIDVEYSSLNYKDGMAVAGRPGITKVHPIVAGIDIVGTVAESEDERWQVGDRVLLNGAGLGETRNGGYSERAIVDGASLVEVPTAFTNRQAAAIGTAGFTAMLSVLALERHGVHPGGRILVTGASGGVGSVAIALLARLGYDVTAASGSLEENGDHLRALGAGTIIERSELAAGAPLQSKRWSAAIDSLGGEPLAAVLSQLEYGGAVAACGMAASVDLPTTVLPFILRAVALLGVNSVDAPLFLRAEAWQRLAVDLDRDLLDGMTNEVGLDEIPAAAQDILAGRLRGRTVVRVRG